MMLIMVLSGCGSVRYASTLKPSADSGLSLGAPRFSMVSMSDNASDSGWIQAIAARSTTLYPGIFTDEWTGLPIEVKISYRHDSSMDFAAFMTGFFTLGAIPFPGKEHYEYSVETFLMSTQGERMPLGKTGFSFDKVMWMSVLGPLGLLPVAGISDIPRDYICLPFTATESFTKAAAKESVYREQCMVEAVLSTLRAADQAKLADDYRVRAARLQEITLDGKRLRVFLVPAFSSSTQARADKCLALVYPGLPKRSQKPLEEVLVATRDEGGTWRPVTGYLRMAATLTSLGVLLEGGMPSKVVVRAVSEPPLADFIATPDMNSAGRNEVLRWSNGVLLDAKNRTLPGLLRAENLEGLLNLVTRIEQAILDLNEKAEQAKDRAQAMVEKAQGDPASEREVAVLLRQRIEILKPILASLKQAAAQRQS